MHAPLLLIIAYIGFISLGFPDPVAGVAWPSVRDSFSLPQSGFGLIFIALGCGYCASGFFGGKLTHFLGLGNLLWISSGLVAVAMFGSGLSPAWPVFVSCAVIWGLGSGGIDAGLNAYASHHFSARHMNWLHACYSVGATLGPLMMTAVLVELGSWRVGYAAVGLLLLLMTLLFLLTKKRWDDPGQAEGEAVTIGIKETLAEPLVWLQILLFFLYVGLEFMVGQWSFTILTESRDVSREAAGVLTSSYYGAIGVGRVLSGVIAARLGADWLVRLAMLMAVLGTGAFAFGSSEGLILVGLGLAPVFPCLMAGTPQRIGKYATQAIGFQVSAGMLGAALVPGMAGLLAEWQSLEAVAAFSVILAALLFANHELLVAMARRRRITAE